MEASRTKNTQSMQNVLVYPFLQTVFMSWLMEAFNYSSVLLIKPDLARDIKWHTIY